MQSIRSHASSGMVYCHIATIGMLAAYTSSVYSAIQGSVHDLSGSGITGEICNVCHTPHINSTNSQAPLWNHEVSRAVYTLYSSPIMDVTAEQLGPGSPSRLCLSCHDGTVSIDSFGGNTGSPDNRLTGSASKGTDLSDDHPIGVRWIHQTQGNGSTTTCLNCHDVYNLSSPPGKELKFFSGRVECPSCHDVHNSQVMDVNLLRKPLAGSQLCLHCHPK